jgi:protein SCO1
VRDRTLRIAVAAAVALVALVLASCAKSSADTFAGAVLHRPYAVPATSLTDTDGRPFSLADNTHHRMTLVFFGYTHCPDECPLTMSTLASALLQLDGADRAQVQVVFATTDPARDTGPVVRHWLDRYNPAFVGLTGTLSKITHVATAVGVPILEGKRLPSGGYDVTHGTNVLAIDGTDTVRIVWTLGTTAPEFAHDIHQLLS